MTRFARAKGSKASNLKSPEDSTPWEVMKEQLLKAKKESEENKNREEAEKQRIENYNNFLKEQKTQKRKATWCDFPEAQTNNKIKENSNENVVKKKKLNKQNTELTSQEKTENGRDKDNIQEINKPTNKNRKKKSKNVEDSIEAPQNISNPQEKNNVSHNQSNNTSPTAQKNKKKKNKKKKPVTEAEVSLNNSEKEVNQAENDDSQNVKNKKNKKKKIIHEFSEVKNNEETDVSVNNSEREVKQTENDDSQNVKNKRNKRKKKMQQMSDSKVTTEKTNAVNETEQKESNISHSPSKKKKEGRKNGRRKPVEDKSFKLIINAKEVQLIRFDGFPIMKKDADRLEELKKSMIQKGIPKSEVQRTMKLERRRAEKALARLKREVCYNCRKGGHNLSDCPDLKSNIPGAGVAEGVCFKCGSTEHRQFECKVQRDKEFRFATCFICKEAGHIARQCPDNPKGLYPNGGSCKLCGDVTHLRKDCPTIKDEKQGTSIKLQTLSDNNIEDIGQNIKPVSEEPLTKKPKKIKF